MFSVNVNGEVKRIRYEKSPIDYVATYYVYLGNNIIASLFKDNNSWCVEVVGDSTYLQNVDGFATREHAVVYALRALGLFECSIDLLPEPDKITKEAQETLKRLKKEITGKFIIPDFA